MNSVEWQLDWRTWDPVNQVWANQIQITGTTRLGLPEILAGVIRGLVSREGLASREVGGLTNRLPDNQAQSSCSDQCLPLQRRQIGRLIKELGMSKDETLAVYESVAGHRVAATIELTIPEARKVIATLATRLRLTKETTQPRLTPERLRQIRQQARQKQLSLRQNNQG